jgi:hypothetical protein
MKKITLFIFLLIFSTGFSQNVPITFETGEFGSTWSFATFENGTGTGYSKVSNPFPGGINNSGTVGKFVAGTTASGAAPYAGFESAHASGVNGIGTFTLSASNSIIKIMVYKTVISDVAIKFAIADGGAQPEIKVPNTKTNQWEELTFDFSGKIGLNETINIDQMILFLDFNARTVETTSYFDNVTFSAKPAATAPTVAAGTPTVIAANVISLFSNAYSNVTVDTWRANWGQSGNVLSDVQVAGNDTKKYTDLSYFGVITEVNKIDASAMLNFHIDVWTPDVTTFKVKIVDFGADGAYQGGDDKEFEVTRTLTLSGWNSLEIPLSEFTGLTTKAHIAQFVFSGTAGTIYIDNVYFNKVVTVAPPAPAPYAPVTFETGEYGSTWTLTSFDNPSGGSTASLLASNPNKTVINTSNTSAKFTALTTGAWYTGFETSHASGVNGIGTFTLDATNSTVKMMVYKDVISKVGIKFVRPDGGSTGEITVTNTKINDWEELTFNFASKIGEGVSTGIDQLIIFPDFIPEGTTRSANHVSYLDNITFSAKISVPITATVPVVAAPTPTVVAANVISLFSDAYTNVTVDSWRANWGQSGNVLSDIQIAGNDTKKYTDLSYFGVITEASKIDASAMLNFHVDVWTPNVTTFKIKIVDFGADGAYQGGDDKEFEVTRTLTLSGWNSLEIPLSEFTGLTTKAHIAQFVFSGSAGTIYIDNVYFNKTAIVVVSTVPTMAAPNPTTAQSNVISLFSNAYTNVTVDNWRADWGQSGNVLSDIQIAGNDTKKYTDLSYFGVITEANKIDATPMLYFHLDVWTPNVATFKVKIVDFGSDGAYQGGDDKEFEVTRTLTLSGWNKLDIPMSEFTGLTTKAHVAQFVFSGSAGTIYMDNVYFSKVAATLSTAKFEISNVKMYPNPVSNYLTIEANSIIEKVSVYNLLGQEVLSRSPKSNSAILQTNILQKGVYIVKTDIDGKVNSSKIIKE